MVNIIKHILNIFFVPLLNGFVLWRRVPSHSHLIAILRNRIAIVSTGGVLFFFIIIIRLINIMLFTPSATNQLYIRNGEIIRKADIVDRNGELLATSIATASCFADPSVVIDIDEAARQLSKIHGMPSIEK